MLKKESGASKGVEGGITPTVQTIFSKFTVGDILNYIAQLKARAVLKWINDNEINPQETLIIGVYLTGATIANELVKSSRVSVVDIYPHLQDFLDPEVSFKESVYELDETAHFDLIIDTTGLGGLSSKELNHLMGHLTDKYAFLAENPTSEGSDAEIKKVDQTKKRLEYLNINRDYYRGYLFTGGLGSKTSGTMTLTMDLLRNSMNDALKREGVLYAVSSLDFYERILFKEKDVDKFLKSMKRPALVISSLKPVDANQIIQKNLDKIYSKISDYSE